MVSLSLMAHRLFAVRPDATVVLVGDPHQLASVEAGAVLGDLVGVGADGGAGASEQTPPTGVRSSIRSLTTIHRQADGSAILPLAAAVAAGRSDELIEVLSSGLEGLRWERSGPTSPHSPVRAELTDMARIVVEQARTGDIEGALAATTGLKVLCATRHGAGGVDAWNRHVEDDLRKQGLIERRQWYPGRPTMVTENDYLNKVFNGDVGVAVPTTTAPVDDRAEVRDGADRFEVWFPRAAGNLSVGAVRLDRVSTQWAMSIHKSQGSEFDHAVVVLPPPPARILTRELLYTAVTRARTRLTIVATEEALRAAVNRPVARASGLVERLV